jgi:Fe-S-cluster containining protein
MTDEMTVNFSYPKNVLFSCNDCGICCGDTERKTRHVLLLRADAERIANHTKQPIDTFANEIKGKEPYVYEMLKNSETGKCAFHKGNRCTVYEVRPLICRFYPFSLSVEDGKFMFRVTEECPKVSCNDNGQEETLNTLFFRRLLETARTELNLK